MEDAGEMRCDYIIVQNEPVYDLKKQDWNGSSSGDVDSGPQFESNNSNGILYRNYYGQLHSSSLAFRCFQCLH